MNEENNEIQERSGNGIDDSTFHRRHLEVKDHPRPISFNSLTVFDINESFISIFVCLNWPVNKGQTSDTNVFQVSSSPLPDWFLNPFHVFINNNSASGNLNGIN